MDEFRKRIESLLKIRQEVKEVLAKYDANFYAGYDGELTVEFTTGSEAVDWDYDERGVEYYIREYLKGQIYGLKQEERGLENDLDILIRKGARYRPDPDRKGYLKQISREQVEGELAVVREKISGFTSELSEM